MSGGATVREAARIVEAQAWCALGTVDGAGVPAVSYTPFAPVDGGFGIVVSRLAAHTANLVARRPASVLLVDVGPAQRDDYARSRLTVAVVPRACTPGSADAAAVWSALEARHGATVATLRALDDFLAMVLMPGGGRLVSGFASAHDLDAASVASALRGG